MANVAVPFHKGSSSSWLSWHLFSLKLSWESRERASCMHTSQECNRCVARHEPPRTRAPGWSFAFIWPNRWPHPLFLAALMTTAHQISERGWRIVQMRLPFLRSCASDARDNELRPRLSAQTPALLTTRRSLMRIRKHTKCARLKSPSITLGALFLYSFGGLFLSLA